jgi:hypothetical protein
MKFSSLKIITGNMIVNAKQMGLITILPDGTLYLCIQVYALSRLVLVVISYAGCIDRRCGLL